jgi:hypothetical protein
MKHPKPKSYKSNDSFDLVEAPIDTKRFQRLPGATGDSMQMRHERSKKAPDLGGGRW